MTVFKLNMSRMINKCHKHLRSIVVFCSKVMDFFLRFKISSNLFLNYKTMFTNITIVCKRMIGATNKNITSLFNFTTFPMARIFPSRCKFWMKFTPRDISFFKFGGRRKMFPFRSFMKFFKMFLARNTFLMNFAQFILMCLRPFFSFIPTTVHFIISKIRALFGGLSRTVIFSHLIRARFMDIKNLSSISIIIIAVLMSLSSNVFGQEVEKNQIFEISDWSGGLNTTLSDQSLPSKYGVTVENVRLNSSLKALTKRQLMYLYGTASATEPILGMHRLYLKSGTKKLIVNFGDEIDIGNDATGAFTKILDLTTGDYRWRWLTWNDVAIGTDGYNQPVKYNGTLATYLGTCAATDNGAGAGPDGTYTYKVSYYTASYEVLFNVASAPVTVVDNDINLSMIPIAPTTYGGENIVGRRVYRNTVAAPATWNLLTNGDIANNTATTLTDSDADGALGAVYPAGAATYTPPKGRLSIVHNNRLWIANDPNYPSRIYFSEDGLLDVFVTGHYFNIRPDDGDEITMLFQIFGKMGIGKTNTMQYFNSDDAEWSNWSYSDPYSSVGCHGIYSSANTPLGVIYLGKDGLYLFNGSNSKLISYAVNSVIADISPSNFSSVWGECNNNIFYATYTSKAAGGSTNNRVLVYDLISQAYEIDTIGINIFCSFSGGTDGGALYAGSSVNGKVLSFATTSQEIIHSIASDFSGTFDECRIIPTDVGGDSTNPIIEMSWDLTINELVGTIDTLYGHIDRNHTTAHYVSQALNTEGASSYDKIYWNELLPSHTNATFAIRSGPDAHSCSLASWSAEYTNPSGSDISGLTVNNYTQYRIAFTTDNIDITPTLIKSGGYVVKLTYNTLGSPYDTSIPLHWQSGYFDMGRPVSNKILTRLSMTYEGTSGIITVVIKNEYGESETFTIDLSVYPNKYEEDFRSSSGKRFNIDITNNDVNALTIKKVTFVYDVEPYY